MTMDCIETTTSRTPKGYGNVKINIGGRVYSIYQHRMAFEQAWGIKIPAGMVVMHTCDNPSCVNPLHLRLGTTLSNNRDSVQKGRHAKASQTHCANGHEWNMANTYMYGNSRQCRACDRERKFAKYQRLESVQ